MPLWTQLALRRYPRIFSLYLRAGELSYSALFIILVPLTGGLLQMYGLVTLQGPLFKSSFVMKPHWAPTPAPLACWSSSCGMSFLLLRSPAEVPIAGTCYLLGSKAYLKPISNCHWPEYILSNFFFMSKQWCDTKMRVRITLQLVQQTWYLSKILNNMFQ